MTDKRGIDGKLLSDEERLTEIGKFIRSTSIDELPQLFNVLKGDNVLYGKYAGTEIELDGEKYLIMRQADVLAII